MADDKTNRGAQDRSRVAGGDEYEVDYFAWKHGITTEQAEQLIEQYGNSRAKLDAAGEKLKVNKYVLRLRFPKRSLQVALLVNPPLVLFPRALF